MDRTSWGRQESPSNNLLEKPFADACCLLMELYLSGGLLPTCCVCLEGNLVGSTGLPRLSAEVSGHGPGNNRTRSSPITRRVGHGPRFAVSSGRSSLL